mgnify:CR=1 FL=1
MTFRDDSHSKPAQPATAATHAWLQVLNGRHRGRIILLQEPVTRFGMAGDLTVMISRRNNGYYLSHLEGEALALVNHAAVNDTVWPLQQEPGIRSAFPFSAWISPSIRPPDWGSFCFFLLLPWAACCST